MVTPVPRRMFRVIYPSTIPLSMCTPMKIRGFNMKLPKSYYYIISWVNIKTLLNSKVNQNKLTTKTLNKDKYKLEFISNIIGQ